MTSIRVKQKTSRPRYGRNEDELHEKSIDDESEDNSRIRTKKKGNAQESDDEETVERSNKSRRRRKENDDTEDDEKEYSSSKRKERKTSKTRGRSYEDDVSDDESSRRSRHQRGADQYNDDEEDESRRSNRKNRSRKNNDDDDGATRQSNGRLSKKTSVDKTYKRKEDTDEEEEIDRKGKSNERNKRNRQREQSPEVTDQRTERRSRSRQLSTEVEVVQERPSDKRNRDNQGSGSRRSKRNTPESDEEVIEETKNIKEEETSFSGKNPFNKFVDKESNDEETRKPRGEISPDNDFAKLSDDQQEEAKSRRGRNRRSKRNDESDGDEIKESEEMKETQSEIDKPNPFNKYDDKDSGDESRRSRRKQETATEEIANTERRRGRKDEGNDREEETDTRTSRNRRSKKNIARSDDEEMEKAKKADRDNPFNKYDDKGSGDESRKSRRKQKAATEEIENTERRRGRKDEGNDREEETDTRTSRNRRSKKNIAGSDDEEMEKAKKADIDNPFNKYDDKGSGDESRKSRRKQEAATEEIENTERRRGRKDEGNDREEETDTRTSRNRRSKNNIPGSDDEEIEKARKADIDNPFSKYDAKAEEETKKSPREALDEDEISPKKLSNEKHDDQQGESEKERDARTSRNRRSRKNIPESDGEEMKETKQRKEQQPMADKENPFQKYDKKDNDDDANLSDDNKERPFQRVSGRKKDEQSVKSQKSKIKVKPVVASKKKNPFMKYESVERDENKTEKEAEKVKSKDKFKDKQAADKDENEENEKKKRRRNKDASSAILDVINWGRGIDDQYQGSDVAPEIGNVAYKSKLSKEDSEVNSNVDVDLTNIHTEEEEEEEQKYKEKKKIDTNYEEKEKDEKEEINVNDEVEQIDHINDRKSRKTSNKASIQVKQNHIKADIEPEEDDEEIFKDTKLDNNVTDVELQESLKFLNQLPDLNKLSGSGLLNNLMDTYLNEDYLIGHSKPSTRTTPKLRTLSDSVEKMDELEKNLKNIRSKNKKQPPPPVRRKPSTSSRSWEDPMEHQRVKNKEKAWPPNELPTDAGSYVVESYGQTDPYSKQLIKDIQKTKREVEEKREAEKRSEIVAENTKPVSTLRSTFTHKPPKPRPGAQRPDIHISEERSWIKHEKKPVVFDAPPNEPDWMTLIRNRRWKSTVKARFPCKTTDRTDFERRSTTPKNWKRLAKDKHALRMLSEIVGIGAEGEELFMRLASQRQKIEDEQEVIDTLTEEELMAYEVARESLGEGAAYNLEMDNPLPAARMQLLNSTSSIKDGSVSEQGTLITGITPQNYPFTTSQLEAAYLTNQLLRLHPEEFRKLMSLERSRQATLRWQFSADPFDSVHEHQSLPFEIALLASEEPRVQQAMKRILAQSQTGENYSSVFSSQAATPIPKIRRTRSEASYRGAYESESDFDGYESSHSISSSSSIGGNVVRGRNRKKKAPVPLPKRPRGRSVSPSMLTRRNSGDNYASGNTLTVPRLNATSAKKQLDDDKEVHAHGLLTDEELALSEEIAKLQELTSNIGRDIEEELKGIESTIDDRKKGYFEEAIRRGSYSKSTNAEDTIDLQEISTRRKDFIKKDLLSTVETDVRDSVPKARHKVRRINSDAQLDAVFRRRRQMSESPSGDEVKQNGNSVSDEMSNLVDDITNTFGK